MSDKPIPPFCWICGEEEVPEKGKCCKFCEKDHYAPEWDYYDDGQYKGSDYYYIDNEEEL